MKFSRARDGASLSRQLTDHFPRCSVRAEAEENRVAQTAVAGPFREAHLSHEVRLEPGTSPHFRARHPLTESPGPFCGQIDEGTGSASQWFERVEELAQAGLGVTASHLARD